METPKAPSVGETGVGAAGAATTVVKLQTVEGEPVPAELEALTRQKYLVLLRSGRDETEVSIIPV